ncbi:MAG: flagellar motor protein MotB [Vallitaleaceae bacterium]|jgi:chemotaxis protein MotB|nr:flagellar motor protein MotB [Vallitaleaceae bacterium]
MVKKRQEEEKGGLPGWMGTYGDLVTLLLCFFVLLFAMSSVDVSKFKAAMSSFADQIDVLPGGIALTGEELITNGISQINEIAIILENRNPTTADTEDQGTDADASSSDAIDDLELTEDQQAAIALAAAQNLADSVMKEFYDALSEEGLETQVDMEATPNYVILTLRGEALFNLGDAVIKPEAERTIAVIAKTYQDKFSEYHLMLEGHTDNKPINTYKYPSNWYLSAARAIAVGEYLIYTVGIPDEMITCNAAGEFHPIESNDTPEGAAANRRVEVKINLGGEEKFVERDTLLMQETPTEGQE